ncbi:MAG: Xaa-Pro peptidase family protein [Gemmobacter sp.]|nr:Xaa-Pro peptidase family protein [Gemmobacter sp.]
MTAQDRNHFADLLPFDPSVYAERLVLVQGEMAERGVAGVLLFDPENTFWLTGYQTIGYFTFQAIFVPLNGRPVVISRTVNRALALAHGVFDDFIAISDTDDPIEVLAGYLARALKPGAPIGVETGAWYLTVRDYKRLASRVASELRDWAGVFEPHRMIKTEAEIALMRRAARAAEAGLEAAIRTVAPGRTENDVAAAMFAANIAAGSEYLGHPPLVVAGETTALCFAMWRRRQIRQGDVVLLEAAGCVDRYHAMLSRPVIAGPAQPQHLEAAHALQEVLETAIASIRPGISAAEVDQSCREALARKGLQQFFRHRAAYGIGIGFPPNWSEGHIYSIRPDEPLILQPNMTFHVIPTLFLDSFGMCFSESVRVTESGCETLTSFERRLFTAD